MLTTFIAYTKVGYLGNIAATVKIYLEVWNTFYYFSGMKESVKIDSTLVEKVRKESKKRGQTMGGFFELAAKQSLTPQYVIRDNCDAFHDFLDIRKIKWKGAGHLTILVDVSDPFGVGMEWAMFKHLHQDSTESKPALSTEVRDK